MSKIEINSLAKFKFRSDTKTKWKENNPVLLSGEIGIEVETGAAAKIKVGDGVTEWNALPYYGDVSEQLASKMDAPTAVSELTLSPDTEDGLYVASEDIKTIRVQVNPVSSSTVVPGPMAAYRYIESDTYDEILIPKNTMFSICTIQTDTDIWHKFILFNAPVRGKISYFEYMMRCASTSINTPFGSSVHLMLLSGNLTIHKLADEDYVDEQDDALQYNIDNVAVNLSSEVSARQQADEELGSRIPTKTSDLTNDSGFITNTDLNRDFYNAEEINENFYNKIETDSKEDALKTRVHQLEIDSADEYYARIDADSALQQRINSVSSQITSEAAARQAADGALESQIPTKTSDLTNDSGFITNTDLETRIEDGIDASNVTYDNTLSDLESTNVKNALDEIVTKFGSVVKVENWEDVQKVVRSGLASKVFKVGEQLECANKNGGTLIWDIIGFDHDVPVNSNYTHSMTILLHDCYTSAVFDAREALFYAETALPAGTYNFKVITQPWYTADNGKTFQFTLVNALTAGSQIVLDMTYNQTLNGKSVKVYSGADSSTVVETATISEGDAGTALGNTDGTVDNLNHIQKAIVGSNRWTHSGLRQWLNTDEASGWWTPQNVFDRPPSNSTSPGFLSVVDDELRAVIGSVTKRTALNTVTDGGTYEDSEELMFLLSRSELYGGLENGINEGDPYPYYSDYSDLSAPGTATDSNRIKYRGGSAQYWWQRSCNSGYAHLVRTVNPSGYISSYSAHNGYGVAPACNVI